MQLIEDAFFESYPSPLTVAPGKCRFDHLGRAMYTVRLAAGGWIGTTQIAVQPVPVTVTRCSLDQSLEVLTIPMERYLHRTGIQEFHFD
jgi:hypothetical protein